MKAAEFKSRALRHLERLDEADLEAAANDRRVLLDAAVAQLQERPWGAHDGTVTDRFGVTWLIGYEGA